MPPLLAGASAFGDDCCASRFVSVLSLFFVILIIIVTFAVAAFLIHSLLVSLSCLYFHTSFLWTHSSRMELQRRSWVTSFNTKDGSDLTLWSAPRWRFLLSNRSRSFGEAKGLTIVVSLESTSSKEWTPPWSVFRCEAHTSDGTSVWQIVVITNCLHDWLFIFYLASVDQMDYVDLLFCHLPDMHTPIEETVRAMNYVIDHGKAFYWRTRQVLAGLWPIYV